MSTCTRVTAPNPSTPRWASTTRPHGPCDENARTSAAPVSHIRLGGLPRLTTVAKADRQPGMSTALGSDLRSQQEQITEHIDEGVILSVLGLPVAGHPGFRFTWNP